MSDISPTDPLLARFRFDRLLRQDEAGRRICLLGAIDDAQALLLAERAAFSTSSSFLDTFSSSLVHTQSLGNNDVYNWYMANLTTSTEPSDLKLTLIYPCDAKHVAKYSVQKYRVVTETPDIYRLYVKPWVQKQITSGRLDWIHNILDGKTEQDHILHKCNLLGNHREEKGYILLPDLNWDQKTLESLHLLAIVQRRDIASVRDLRKKDVPWLRALLDDIGPAVEKLYGSDSELGKSGNAVEADMLKLYIHCKEAAAYFFTDDTYTNDKDSDQPTYYHMHIHIMHVAAEPVGQAVGKAISLRSVISQLETMTGEPDASMAETEQTFTIGEAHELWKKIFGPLKAGKTPDVEL